MGTGTAEGHESIWCGAQQNAGLDVCGVGKNFRAADGNVFGLRDDARRIGLRAPAKECPKGRSQARKSSPKEK
jgi:hypothetical protein